MDDLTIVKVGDLDRGDEIIITNNGDLVYAKVLKKPSVSNKKAWSYLAANPTLYTSVKCSVHKEDVTYCYQYNGITKSYIRKKTTLNSTDHNKIRHFNLNRKNILLIKKGKEL